MSWQRTHRRYRLVHAVLEDVATTGEVSAESWAPAIDAEFGGFGAFLADLQRRWYTSFDARLDALLEDEPADLPQAVRDLWHRLAGANRAAMALLEAHAGDPALIPGTRRHRQALLRATGVDEYHLGTPPVARPSCPLARLRKRALAGAGVSR